MYFLFGNKFSCNEGIDTCFNVECVLFGRNFDFLTSYLVVTARYRSLLLVPSFRFFFLFWFSFTNIHDSRDSRGRGRVSILTPLYHLHPLRWGLDISRAIAAESSPLRIAGRRTRAGNLWFPSTSR